MRWTSTRITALIKKYGWGLNLVFIALGAYFVAGAANAVVARSIRVVPTLEAAAREVPPSTAGSRPKGEYEAMAQRNLFGVKREDLSPVSASSDGPPMLVSGNNYREADLKPCTLTSTVRATLVAEGAPDWSMAVIFNGTSRDTEVFSPIEGANQVADDAWLVEVRSREIIVRRRDHFELCAAEGESKGATTTAMATSAAPQIVSEDGATPHPEASGLSAGGEGVRQLSETQFDVDKTEVDKALGDLSQVSTQARIVPSFKNGKANGFKLFSIKPGSIFAKIGLQNGDVIQKINGYEMSSPDKALEVWQKLTNASSVQIEMQRRGRTMNMAYNIR